MIVDVDLRKWIERPHWRFSAEHLGRDEYGTWLGADVPTPYTGPRGAGVWPHAFVALVPTGEWWVAAWNDEREGAIEVYVDVTTEPRWLTENHVTAIDLDLDVVRRRDGTVFLDDVDEFEEHQLRYGYPVDMVDKAIATSKVLMEAVESRREPFSRIGPSWLAKLLAG
jgi:hypothetical protein